MKKLNILQVNSEKLIKNYELVSLKGGFEGYFCSICYDSGEHPVGYMAGAGSQEDCVFLCQEAGYHNGSYGPGGMGNCQIKSINITS